MNRSCKPLFKEANCKEQPRVVPPNDASSKRTYRGGVIKDLAFLGSITLLLWQGYEWIAYPIDQFFPYSQCIPLVLFAGCVQLYLWRSAWFHSPKKTRSTLSLRSRRIVGSSVFLFTLLVLISYGVTLRHVQNTLAQMGGVPAIETSVVFPDCTVAMEDGNFYSHRGIDLVALHRALRANIQAGKVKQGGSTITQQLAKNLFLTEERTIGRKIRELFYTVALEASLSKREILHLYIQSIDYGMGQKGIHAASNYYFGKRPADISLAEAAVLVSFVPSPPRHWLSGDAMEEGRRKALGRLQFWFPRKYSDTEVDAAASIPLENLVLPYCSPAMRGAGARFPATLHGVGCYFFARPEEPALIPSVSPLLLEKMGKFFREAHRRYGVIGIDHLGVYADRPQRGTDAVPSAHAYGQALDISGFRFADGRQVKVIDHDQPAAREVLEPLQRLLQECVDVVVSWKEDPKRHDNHFHAEVKGKRGSLVRSHGVSAEESVKGVSHVPPR